MTRRETSVHGSLAICIDPNCFITSIVATDVADIDLVLEDLQQHCGWDLKCTDKARHYAELKPVDEVPVLRGFEKIHRTLLKECDDQITSVNVVPSDAKAMTKILIKSLDVKISEIEKSLTQHRSEIKNSGQSCGDSIDRAVGQSAITDRQLHMERLGDSHQRQVSLHRKLKHKSWNGFCEKCKHEPVPLKRAETTDALICIGCTKN
jgi:hypothetical protein